jgi:hypothetical protein
MKRDMDLVREMLNEVEKVDTYGTQIYLKIEGYSKKQIDYHILLLSDADLIKTDPLRDTERTRRPVRLTWEGHEFVEAARDDTRWNQAKEMMKGTGGFVFEIAKSLLIDLAKEQIKTSLQ